MKDGIRDTIEYAKDNYRKEFSFMNVVTNALISWLSAMTITLSSFLDTEKYEPNMFNQTLLFGLTLMVIVLAISVIIAFAKYSLINRWLYLLEAMLCIAGYKIAQFVPIDIMAGGLGRLAYLTGIAFVLSLGFCYFAEKLLLRKIRS